MSICLQGVGVNAYMDLHVDLEGNVSVTWRMERIRERNVKRRMERERE